MFKPALFFEVDGERIDVRTLARRAGIHRDTVRQRLRAGMSPKEIAATPRRHVVVGLAGRRVGRLVVRSRGPNRSGRSAWHCDCDCGRTTLVNAYYLKTKKIRSCGCLLSETSRAKAHKFRWNGGSYTLDQLAQRTGIPRGRIRSRLQHGFTVDEALASARLRTGPKHTLVGQTFGWLTVTDRVGTTKDGAMNWLCVCRCGAQVRRTTTLLRREGHRRNTSCGCHRRTKLRREPRRPADLSGRVFGSIHVLGPADAQGTWRCRCVCGKEMQLPRAQLGPRRKRTCGCGIDRRQRTFDVFGQVLTLRDMAEVWA